MDLERTDDGYVVSQTDDGRWIAARQWMLRLYHPAPKRVGGEYYAPTTEAGLRYVAGHAPKSTRAAALRAIRRVYAGVEMV